jgi:hypothetical protein
LWACGLVLLGAVLILHREVLFGGQVYHLEDAADGYYPSHVAILRAWSHGELPTWERGAWCGWPLAADPYYGPFYPFTLLLAIFGAVGGIGPTIALHMLVSALSTFWLLRRRKLELGPSLLGAVSLGFCTFAVVRIRHITFAELFAWLPLILVGVEGYLDTRRPRELILAAAATGMAILCGALPLALFVILTFGCYVIPRLWKSPEPKRATGWLLAAAGLGVVLGAAQLVTTFVHLPYSPRSLGADYAFSTTYAWPNLGYLGTLIAPDLFGTEERARWFGQYNHWEMAGWYVGLCAVLLAPLGLMRARKKPELAALGVLSLVGILLAFGDSGPLHRFFFRFMPLYAAMRCPTRALVMDLIALPILAAEGLDWLLEKERRRRLALGAGLAAASCAIASISAWFLMRSHKNIPQAHQIARAAWAHAIGVLGAGGAVLALGLTAAISRRVAAIALALVALGDLISIERGYVQPKPREIVAGTERFTAVDWLIDQHPSDRFVPAATGPFRLHNVGMTYGLENAGGYDSLTVWRTVQLLWTINHGSPYPHKALKDDLAAGTLKRFDTPLVDLMNVRWAIAAEKPAPDWIEVFRPTPGAAPHANHEPWWDPQLKVFENPHAMPRAFVVYNAIVSTDEAALLPKLDPRQSVILDRAPDPAPISDLRPFQPATVVSAERHRVVVEADTPVPGILVLSESWYPGWSVTVDGKPAPLLRADYAFRGVALAPGKHRVEMRFRSLPTKIGLALSGLGLLGLLALWLRGRRSPSVV